jgi:hypothetical protein
METAAYWNATRWASWTFAGFSEKATASIFREQKMYMTYPEELKKLRNVSVRIASLQAGI